MRVVLTERSTIDRIGGVNTFIFELSEALLKMGVEVYVATFSSNISQHKIRELYDVSRVPKIITLKEWSDSDYWPPRGSSLRDQTIWFVRGSKAVNGINPDLVIVNGAVPLIKNGRGLYVTVVHTLCPHIEYLLNKKMGLIALKALYELYDYIVPITIREYYCLKQWLRINDRKIRIIPICLNTSKYRSNSIKDREVSIIHVGTSGAKNLEATIEVFNNLCTNLPNLKLYIAGSFYEYPEKLVQKNVREECRNRVVKLDKVSREFLRGVLPRVRVLLAPSIHEGLPYATLEALASGTPAVASYAIPGHVVIDGFNGFRIRNPYDVEKFTEKTYELLADDSLWEKLSLNARRHVQQFDCINVAKEYLNLLYERPITS